MKSKYLFCPGTALVCIMLLCCPVATQATQQSTYFGGSGKEGGFLITAMTEAPDGSVYLAGTTKSDDLPVPSQAFQTSRQGGTDLLIARFSSDLKTLLAATWLGGSASDTLGRNNLIQCDSQGNVYLVMETLSADFPVTDGCYNSVINGDADCAVVKLDGQLETLLYATFLGGSNYESPQSLCIDSTGRVFISGWTRSTDFPTTPGAYDESYNGHGGYSYGGDLFVTCLDGTLSTVEAGTFIGSTSMEYGGAMVIDSAGLVYLTGGSSSPDYPVTDAAYDRTHGGTAQGDGVDTVVTVLSSSLATVDYSTFLGGSLDEWGYALEVGPQGHIWVTGHTSSEDFPVTHGAWDTSFNGLSGMDTGDDVFIARFNSDVSDLEKATYIGGTYWDCANWIDVTASGDVFVAGQAASDDFPVPVDGFQNQYSGGQNQWGGETFLCRFDMDLSEYEAGTFFGGAQDDGVGQGLILSDGDIALCGYTLSEDLPGVSGGYDPDYNAGSGPASRGDLFLMRINPDLTDSSQPSPTPTPDTLWLNLVMPDQEMDTGDTFLLSREWGNPSGQSMDVDEYLILDVAGAFWFWPGWTQDVDFSGRVLGSASTGEDTILEFTWPAVDGSFTGIRFWGAFLEQGTMNLLIYTWIEWSY